LNILIFGGTRFVGKSFLLHALAAGHNLTVISRRAPMAHPRLTYVQVEKDFFNPTSDVEHFDVILDFLAYDAETTRRAQALFPFTPYVMISSAWVSQYILDQRIFSPREHEYIRGKLRAETLLEEKFRDGFPVKIIRLPITFGSNDHTNRFHFYLSRCKRDKPIIMIDGGVNDSTLAFKDDVSAILLRFISSFLSDQRLLYEALPRPSICPRDLVTLISDLLHKHTSFLTIAREKLQQDFPEYLEVEPLSRETCYAHDHTDLYKLTGFSPTPVHAWVSALVKERNPDFKRAESSWNSKGFLTKEAYWIRKYDRS